MTRTILARSALGMLAALAIACGYDSTSPGAYGTPPVDSTPAAPSPLAGLWTSSGSNPALFRLASEQLTGASDVVPATTVVTPSAPLFTLNSIAFDDAGTLWVASQDDSVLLSFPASRLDTTRFSVAERVITPIDESLSAPSGIAFDRRHNLWVANNANGTVVRYDSLQLVAGGPQVPAVTLSQLGHPTGLAFDADGALWISDNRGNRLFSFGAAKLAVSGKPGPDILISNLAGALNVPSGIAFAADGTLWVANLGRQNVVAFSPAQLAAGGALAPAIVLSPAANAVTLPTGLAFDAAGALWVVSGDGRLAKFDRGALGVSGQPEASVALRVPAHTIFWSLAFWPKVRSLPLN